MTKERLTVTVDSELIEAAHEAVEEGRVSSLSGWVNLALAERAAKERRLRALAEAVAAYEDAFGKITAAEITAQERKDRRHAVVVRSRRRRKKNMILVLDSGALIALERNDRAMWSRIKAALLRGEIPITHGGVVGQAWRGPGPRSTLLSKALAGIDVRPLGEDLGKRAGELLARSKRSDVIDAALVLLASDGDVLVTSDSQDLKALARAADRLVDLIDV